MRKGNLELKDNEIEVIYEKTITKFGNGAKIVDSPKEYLGKKVYVLVRKD